MPDQAWRKILRETPETTGMENHKQGNTGERQKGNTAISMATVKRKNIAGHPEVSGRKTPLARRDQKTGGIKKGENSPKPTQIRLKNRKLTSCQDETDPSTDEPARHDSVRKISP